MLGEGLFDPWSWADELGVSVYYERLPGQLCGLADPAGLRVTLDRRLGQIEQRCVLTHELIHVKRQDQGRQTMKVELSVRRTTALLLLPDETALWGVAHLSLPDAAEELHVTADVLQDRIHTLNPSERASVREAHWWRAMEAA